MNAFKNRIPPFEYAFSVPDFQYCSVVQLMDILEKGCCCMVSPVKKQVIKDNAVIRLPVFQEWENGFYLHTHKMEN